MPIKAAVLTAACLCLLCPLVLGGAGGGGNEPGTRAATEKAPGTLHEYDADRSLHIKPWTQNVFLNDIVQFSVHCRPLEKGEDLRALRVELKGESSALAGPVVEVPVWRERSKGVGGPPKIRDREKKILCIFLRTERVGGTIVRITPVGADGKDRPVRELAIKVLPPLVSR